MKKQLTNILLIAVFIGFNCDLNAGKTVITGLTNGQKTELVLDNYFRSFTTSSNSNGRFYLQFELESPGYFELKGNKTIHLFIIPGDSLYVNLLNNSCSGGESAKISNYLIHWFHLSDSLSVGFDRVKYYSQNTEEFTNAVKSLYSQLGTPLKSLVNKHPSVNKEFVRLEDERIKYWVWCSFNRYEYRYQLYTGKKAALPANFYNYFNEINLNDSAFFQFPEYEEFVATMIGLNLKKAYDQNNKAFLDPYFKTKFLVDFIPKTFTDKKILNQELKAYMMGQIDQMDMNDSLFKTIENTMDPTYLKDLKQYYREMKVFETGQLAPDFVLKDRNDSTFTLKSFKGKYLLIDVWGITCGPCIKEMPTLNEIKNNFKDENLTVIQVNMSGTKEAWLKKVKELNLGGIQLMPDQGWKSEFQKNYNIASVPAYILIDPEGRFVDARAPLPSDNLNDVLTFLFKPGN